MSGVMQLALYDSMCRAIVACHDVDEVASIQDKAYAMQVYAQQVKNIEAERKACEIRMRAERRFGELLAELARAPGQRTDLTSSNGETRLEAPPSPYSDALHRTGISRQTAHRYQQLAQVPEPVFAAAMADPNATPSTAGVINAARKPAPAPAPAAIDPVAVAQEINERHHRAWVGVTQQIRWMAEACGCAEPVVVARELKGGEAAVAKKNALEVIAWLTEFEQCLPAHKERPRAR